MSILGDHPNHRVRLHAKLHPVAEIGKKVGWIETRMSREVDTLTHEYDECMIIVCMLLNGLRSPSGRWTLDKVPPCTV